MSFVYPVQVSVSSWGHTELQTIGWMHASMPDCTRSQLLWVGAYLFTASSWLASLIFGISAVLDEEDLQEKIAFSASLGGVGLILTIVLCCLYHKKETNSSSSETYGTFSKPEPKKIVRDSTVKNNQKDISKRVPKKPPEVLIVKKFGSQAPEKQKNVVDEKRKSAPSGVQKDQEGTEEGTGKIEYFQDSGLVLAALQKMIEGSDEDTSV